jgi:hypothetical protein
MPLPRDVELQCATLSSKMNGHPASCPSGGIAAQLRIRLDADETLPGCLPMQPWNAHGRSIAPGSDGALPNHAVGTLAQTLRKQLEEAK